MSDNASAAFSINFPSDLEFEISRIFDAPRKLVFEAHSSCEHLARWLGPRDLPLVECEMDVRPGGRYRLVHRGREGVEAAFRGEFREIDPPERMVRTFEFEAMPGHISVETLTLREKDGKTQLTVRARFSSQADRDAMVGSGMESGVRESWDRLSELLSELKRVGTGE